MKAPALAIVIVASTLLTACERDPDWIRIRTVGWQDKPLPTIWLSQESHEFSDRPFNYTIVLSRANYQRVQDLIRNTHCIHREPGALTDFGATELAENENSKESVRCIFTRAEACSFIPQLIDSISSDSWPLQNYASAIDCRVGPNNSFKPKPLRGSA